jgi:uncharacterized membrane protein
MDNLILKYQQKEPVKAMLGIGSVLCISLLIFRVCLASSFHYVFLVWNLFLAWIPLILSDAISKMDKQNKSGWAIGAVFCMWLLFFPNSPYILTDLFHLKQNPNIPLWYDLGLLISYAWSGLMLGFISLLEIQKLLDKKFTSKLSWIIVICILLLSSFGIYLGRFERWNSWDIITNPVSLISDIIDRIMSPFTHPRTFGVTLLFFLFLIISYLTLFSLIKSKSHEQ